MFTHFNSMPRYRPLILEVDTTKPGSASNTFVLSVIANNTLKDFGYSCNGKIDWGDGSSEYLLGPSGQMDITHVYSSHGKYIVKLHGIRNEIGVRPYLNNAGDCAKLIQILDWGSSNRNGLNNSFYGCVNLAELPNNPPKFVSLTNTQASSAFRGCVTLNSFVNFDTSCLTNMANMFYGCTALKQPFAHFNIQSLTTASSMFFGCDLNQTGTTTHYDALLNGWASQAFLPNVAFHAGTSKYSSAASAARTTLVAAGWTITDGGPA